MGLGNGKNLLRVRKKTNEAFGSQKENPRETVYSKRKAVVC
ncbi:uncharacterized protein G2W53_005701 [Senna tora]|uniref:Uncharacterized protein n=1 Tax=Senna tora TaxID=362788 RepID=A0A834X3C9_9FABA|nr:uncharacterized protein G2W53_005701 [Senna tora]